MRVIGLLVVLSMVWVAGCASSVKTELKSLPGNYLGEGKFHSQNGSLSAQVQLELAEDGSYKLLWLKPAAMVIFGVENGNWEYSGSTLILTPQIKEVKPFGSTFDKLSAASSTSAIVKSLAVQDGALDWADGQMNIRFSRRE